MILLICAVHSTEVVNNCNWFYHTHTKGKPENG